MQEKPVNAVDAAIEYYLLHMIWPRAVASSFQIRQSIETLRMKSLRMATATFENRPAATGHLLDKLLTLPNCWTCISFPYIRIPEARNPTILCQSCPRANPILKSV